MIGGTVVGIARRPECALLHVEDRRPDEQRGCFESDAIRVVEVNRKTGKRICIGLGDCIWTQGGWALWTPMENMARADKKLRCSVDFDIQLPLAAAVPHE